MIIFKQKVLFGCFFLLYLISQHLGPSLLCLLLMDVLLQDTRVLDLCLQVELMVQVAINLLGLPEIGYNLLVVYGG